MFKKLFILIIVYTIFIFFFKGYCAFYPSIPVYPDNKYEAKQVKKYIESRTQQDIDFFYKTNKSVIFAFKPYVKESLEELTQIEQSQNYIILAFKYLINRSRPEQLHHSIKPINTDTAQTPSYPGGHTYQAHLLAKVLSKRYPSKKHTFEKIAEEINITRVKAGLHYPSDGIFSKRLVDIFNRDS